MTSRQPVVLGGYPAKLCARSVHNDFSPASPPKPPVDAATRKLFDAGNAFEDLVNHRLAMNEHAAILADDAEWDATIEATVAAMHAGTPVIVNGRLPRAGARVGAPDVLVRMGDGYVPVDVKNHATRKPATRGSSWVSTLDRPADRRLAKGLSDAGGSWESDGMQLAHYTRMLQDLGFHAGSEHLVGGIIGSSDYTPEGGNPWLVAWYDLSAPRKATFSATETGGRAKRSLLERYDHEFAFRLQVAEAAKASEEIVRPFQVAECSTCVWAAYCREVVGPQDASFAIGAGLPTAQQWRFLYDAGITTLGDLATADPQQVPQGWSERDTQPGSQAAAKYRNLVRRARMAHAGIPFAPLGAWPQIPAADVEVDFDVEWDFEGRIYLWGLRVRQGQDDATAVFDPVVSFGRLDDEAAAALASQFARRLRALVTRAERSGRSVLVFHWSHPERSMTSKYVEVDELLEERAFDLHAWFRTHFLTVNGSSIKKVAPLFDFHWDVDDPGGAESQLKVEAARGDDPRVAGEARTWLTRYNRSDVAAQAAIRDGLRAAKSVSRG